MSPPVTAGGLRSSPVRSGRRDVVGLAGEQIVLLRAESTVAVVSLCVAVLSGAPAVARLSFAAVFCSLPEPWYLRIEKEMRVRG